DCNQVITQQLAPPEPQSLQAVFQLPARMTSESAHAIADAVLLHPMICKTGFRLGTMSQLVSSLSKWPGAASLLKWIDEHTNRDHSGEVVEREELTRILLEFAAG